MNEELKMSSAVKEQRVVARCTVSEKKKFNEKVKSMGWKDTTAFMISVVHLVNAGKLGIQPPNVLPTVIFTE